MIFENITINIITQISAVMPNISPLSDNNLVSYLFLSDIFMISMFQSQSKSFWLNSYYLIIFSTTAARTHILDSLKVTEKMPTSSILKVTIHQYTVAAFPGPIQCSNLFCFGVFFVRHFFFHSRDTYVNYPGLTMENLNTVDHTWWFNKSPLSVSEVAAQSHRLKRKRQYQHRHGAWSPLPTSGSSADTPPSSSPHPSIRPVPCLSWMTWRQIDLWAHMLACVHTHTHKRKLIWINEYVILNLWAD